MTYTVRCETCGRQLVRAGWAESEAWIKYHNAVWPTHVLERLPTEVTR